MDISNRITAAEARDKAERVANKIAAEHLQYLYDEIHKAAEIGRREVFVEDTPYRNWGRDGCELPKVAKEVLAQLEVDKFTIRHHSSNGYTSRHDSLRIMFEAAPDGK